MPHTLKTVDTRYGAPMGRSGQKGDPDWYYRFSLRRVRLDAGGYDSGGAYWGHGREETVRVSFPGKPFPTVNVSAGGSIRPDHAPTFSETALAAWFGALS